MDTQKSIIEEKLESLQEDYNNGSKIKEVVDIFNDYFGEEFVDITYRSEFLKQDILKYRHIGYFISNFCNVRTVGRDTRITCGTIDISVNTETFNSIIPKSMLEFPEELLPIVEAYWINEITRDASYIIVRFPYVTVTNENNKSINIQELYAKVSIKPDGRLHRGFELIRSYYPIDQWNSDYCHSHISHISTEWLEPCTGSGPINSTMGRLFSAFDENVWGLFCYELDKFVRVESIAGVPYKRLESVGLTNDIPITLPRLQSGSVIKKEIISDELVKDFIKTLIKEIDFKISFTDGSYSLGEPIESFWIKASRIFAKWYNEKYKEHKVTADLKTLVSKEVVNRCIIRDGKVYSIRKINRNNIQSSQGLYLFTFKGKDVKLVIDESKNNTASNETYLLSIKFISKLIQNILIIINYNYGRQEETTTEETQPKGRTIYT